MRRYNDKEVVGRFYNNKIISATYLGLKLVWQAVKSCFGAGFWRNDKPWDNKEGYKN